MMGQPELAKPEAGAAPEFNLARLGDDEFTALIGDIPSPTDAIALAKRMGQLMRRPFVLDGREIVLTARFGIALDDFGTGYSSLADLARLLISNIMIDKCFVSGLPDDGQSKAIVRAVLAMADCLGMNVAAEGVETLAQAQAAQLPVPA